MPVIGGMEIKMGVFFDIYNVRKPGKGVEKKEYTPRFQLYFELVWRKMWMFCKTNLLYLAACVIALILIWFGYSAVAQGTLATLKGVMFLTVCTIYLSIVGIGIFAPGLSYLTRNFARERHVWIFSDFKDAVVDNFKKSVILFIADSLIVYVSYIVFTMYAQFLLISKLMYIPMGFFAVCLLIYLMMHFYIYPIMVTFDLSMKDILKDSLILTVAHFPWNLLILFIVSVFSFLIYLFNITIGLLIAGSIGITLLNFTVNFMVDPIIDRYLYIPAEIIAEDEKNQSN